MLRAGLLTRFHKPSTNILTKETSTPIACCIDNDYMLSGEAVKLDTPPYTFYYQDGGLDKIFSESLREGSGRPPHRIYCAAINPFVKDRSLIQSGSPTVWQPVDQNQIIDQSQRVDQNQRVNQNQRVDQNQEQKSFSNQFLQTQIPSKLPRTS